MFLRSITLRNFRNHGETNLQFNQLVNIFTGGNGEGKTNVLEAVFYLTAGRSHRTHRDQELVRWGADHFAIRAEIVQNSGLVTVDIYYGSDNTKRIKINGVELKRIADMVGRVNAVIFAPENLILIKGGPAERRKFLDFAASQARPQYFFYLQNYHHVLMQRNRLLRLIADKKARADSLDVWDEQLVEYGTQVVRRRWDIVQEMQTILRPIHFHLTDQAEDMLFTYQSALSESGDFTVAGFAQAFRTKLLQSRREETARGYTVVGPHRDDLQITANATDLRIYGSQGQQRTAALSLKLAEVEFLRQERKEYPLLLLDDVMSELDDRRRQYLLQYIGDKLQAFVTSTNLNPFAGRLSEPTAVFKVEAGQVVGSEE